MIKVIIFDLGGVLFTNGTKRMAKLIAEKHNLDSEKVYDLLNYSDIGNAYREGTITRDEFWDTFKQRMGIDEDTNLLEKKWIEVYEVVEDVKQLINTLRQNHKVYFLSDNVKERVEGAKKKYAFTSWFDGGIFSHEVGVRKPNLKIYQLTLQQVGSKPEETLFVDDKSINLPPAQKLGMKTLLFTSVEQFQKDLEALDLLTGNQ